MASGGTRPCVTHATRTCSLILEVTAVVFSGAFAPSANGSTLPLVQDTVFGDVARRWRLQEDALEVTGEWFPKVWIEKLGEDVKPHKWMRKDSSFEHGFTHAERRTPLPEDAGISAGYMLPGEDVGSIKIDCGQVYAVLWCSSCDPSKKKWTGEKKKSCTNRLCPQCFSHWLHRQSDEVSDRLYQFRRAVGYSGRHIVFSPPVEERFKPIKWLRQRCYQLADLSGLAASVVVLHLWRFRDLEGREIAWKWCSLNPQAQSNIDHVNSEFQKGAVTRPAPCDSPISCRRFYYPHFHMIAWGWLMKSDEFESKSDGWIYKNLDAGKKGRASRKELYRTIRYMLSHAAIKSRSMTYVYRGYLHYTKWDTEQTWTEEQEVDCPKCGTQLTMIFVKTDGGLGKEEPAVVDVTLRLYNWKGGRPPENWWLKFQEPDLEDGLDFTGVHAPVLPVEFVAIDEE